MMRSSSTIFTNRPIVDLLLTYLTSLIVSGIITKPCCSFRSEKATVYPETTEVHFIEQGKDAVIWCGDAQFSPEQSGETLRYEWIFPNYISTQKDSDWRLVSNCQTGVMSLQSVEESDSGLYVCRVYRTISLGKGGDITFVLKLTRHKVKVFSKPYTGDDGKLRCPIPLTLFIDLTSIFPRCVPCESGEYYDSRTETCKLCPSNTYNNKYGLSKCEECPRFSFAFGEGHVLKEDCRDILVLVLGEDAWTFAAMFAGFLVAGVLFFVFRWMFYVPHGRPRKLRRLSNTNCSAPRRENNTNSSRHESMKFQSESADKWRNPQPANDLVSESIFYCFTSFDHSMNFKSDVNAFRRNEYDYDVSGKFNDGMGLTDGGESQNELQKPVLKEISAEMPAADTKMPEDTSESDIFVEWFRYHRGKLQTEGVVGGKRHDDDYLQTNQSHKTSARGIRNINTGSSVSTISTFISGTIANYSDVDYFKTSSPQLERWNAEDLEQRSAQDIAFEKGSAAGVLEQKSTMESPISSRQQVLDVVDSFGSYQQCKPLVCYRINNIEQTYPVKEQTVLDQQILYYPEEEFRPASGIPKGVGGWKRGNLEALNTSGRTYGDVSAKKFSSSCVGGSDFADPKDISAPKADFGDVNYVESVHQDGSSRPGSSCGIRNSFGVVLDDQPKASVQKVHGLDDETDGAMSDVISQNSLVEMYSSSCLIKRNSNEFRVLYSETDSESYCESDEITRRNFTSQIQEDVKYPNQTPQSSSYASFDSNLSTARGIRAKITDHHNPNLIVLAKQRAEIDRLIRQRVDDHPLARVRRRDSNFSQVTQDTWNTQVNEELSPSPERNAQRQVTTLASGRTQFGRHNQEVSSDSSTDSGAARNLFGKRINFVRTSREISFMQELKEKLKVRRARRKEAQCLFDKKELVQEPLLSRRSTESEEIVGKHGPALLKTCVDNARNPNIEGHGRDLNSSERVAKPMRSYSCPQTSSSSKRDDHSIRNSKAGLNSHQKKDRDICFNGCGPSCEYLSVSSCCSSPQAILKQ